MESEEFGDHLVFRRTEEGSFVIENSKKGITDKNLEEFRGTTQICLDNASLRACKNMRPFCGDIKVFAVSICSYTTLSRKRKTLYFRKCTFYFIWRTFCVTFIFTLSITCL